jgi:ribonucleoside-diphosphate reductase alpha chain
MAASNSGASAPSPEEYLRALADGLDIAKMDVPAMLQDIPAVPTTIDHAMPIARAIAHKYFIHEDYSFLAGRVVLDAVRKAVPATFSQAVHERRSTLDPVFRAFVQRNAAALDAMIDHSADARFDFLATNILLSMYLMKRADGTLCETPQYMFLRIASYLYFTRNEAVARVISEAPDDASAQEVVKLAEAVPSAGTAADAAADAAAIAAIADCYRHLSSGLYSHGTPTMLNAGKVRSQLASCFTLTIEDDLTSLMESWRRGGLISKFSGGLGMDFSSIRHSMMSHGGETKGVVPWIRILEAILEAIDQNTVRPGSCACYLSDWHIDINAFVDLRRPTGDPKTRAPNMYYGVVISDELMRRAVADEEWTLFCPTVRHNGVPLHDLWGVEFEMAYRALEEDYRAGRISSSETRVRVIKARSLLTRIATTQQETGMPYVMFADSVNRKTQHRHRGKIRLSNLCSEITLFTDKSNIGSCNLASVVLSACLVRDGSARLPPCAESGGVHAHVPAATTTTGNADAENAVEFDFGLLEAATRRLVRNLNQVIDRTFYPSSVPDVERTNLRDRPLGIGVQDLGGVFAEMGLAWESPEAKALNSHIFEAMYFFALDESCRIAEENGDGGCEFFAGSPMSKGQFQFDLWEEEIAQKVTRSRTPLDGQDAPSVGDASYVPPNFTPRRIAPEVWDALRVRIVTHGLANNMLIALMPTATSARLAGGTEGIEPQPDNVYMKTLKSGSFVVVNKRMMRDLREAGAWKTDFVRQVWAESGNLAQIPCPPGVDANVYAAIQERYKAVFDIKQSALINMAADRGRFVCQSQSFNFWKRQPNVDDLLRYFNFAWKQGMKTLYYVRRQPAANARNNSVEALSVPERDGDDAGTAAAPTTDEEEKAPRGRGPVVCTDDVCVSCSA